MILGLTGPEKRRKEENYSTCAFRTHCPYLPQFQQSIRIAGNKVSLHEVLAYGTSLPALLSQETTATLGSRCEFSVFESSMRSYCAPCPDLINWRPDMSVLGAKLICTFGLSNVLFPLPRTLLCANSLSSLIYTHIPLRHFYPSQDYRLELLCFRRSSSTFP